MTEKELADQIKKFQELAKTNKDVDVTSLALNALHSHQANMLTTREKRWAYLASLAIPPFGLIFAVKFYYSGKDDGLDAAAMCIILTFISIIVFALLFKLSFTGVSTQIPSSTGIDQLLQ